VSNGRWGITYSGVHPKEKVHVSDELRHFHTWMTVCPVMLSRRVCKTDLDDLLDD